MIKTPSKMRLCVSLLCLELIFIWGNSLLPGSVSGAISGWLRDVLSRLLPFMGEDPSTGHGLLRKLAHFTEFACLGACLAWLFSMLGKGPWPALGCGILAACVDETIQRFVPDRGPSIFDVGIDSAGVSVGILLLLAGYHMYKSKKMNGGNEK